MLGPRGTPPVRSPGFFPPEGTLGTTTMSHRGGQNHWRVTSSWLGRGHAWVARDRWGKWDEELPGRAGLRSVAPVDGARECGREGWGARELTARSQWARCDIDPVRRRRLLARRRGLRGQSHHCGSLPPIGGQRSAIPAAARRAAPAVTSAPRRQVPAAGRITGCHNPRYQGYNDTRSRTP
jgi:hypothetical protein